MTGKSSPVAFFLRALSIALVAAVAMSSAPMMVTPAYAQAGERQSGTGLLRFLFPRNDAQRQQRATPQRGAPQVQQTPRRATTSQQRSQQQRPATSRQTAAPAVAAPAPEAVDKAEDAERVLVVGDFLAGGLADGLTAAFIENPDVVVIDRSNGSSGLVRDDYYDWPGNIGEVMDAVEPALVVVMIGSNDRQQMNAGGARHQPRTDEWTAEYERRVGALAKAIRDRNLPLVWVGNLPFRSGAMSSDMIAFNDIYRRLVADAGGEFLDVWDGFVDENGAFVTSGPDMNGQPAQLRAGDGINVTRSGRRKIAFYAEKPLNRILESGTDPAAAVRLDMPGPDGELLIPEELDGVSPPAKIDRTVPVSIDDPELDSASGLLGAVVMPGNGQRGNAPDRADAEDRRGRADDFTVRRAAARSTPADSQEETPEPRAADETDPETTTALTP